MSDKKNNPNLPSTKADNVPNNINVWEPNDHVKSNMVKGRQLQ